MKIKRVRKKYLTGWGTGKNQTRPFSEEEYNRSYIKKNGAGSYDRYLRDIRIIRLEKVKKSEKKVRKVRRVKRVISIWS